MGRTDVVMFLWWVVMREAKRSTWARARAEGRVPMRRVRGGDEVVEVEGGEVRISEAKGAAAIVGVGWLERGLGGRMRGGIQWRDFGGGERVCRS